MKTIKIHGKDYVTVNERLMYFRKEFPEWSLETEIVHCNEKICLVKAIIKDSDDRIRATGIAQEVAGTSHINKTSHVENAETSAWGRALGCLGIGIDTSIASAEEVLTAANMQATKMDEMPSDIRDKFKQLNYTVGKVKTICGEHNYDWEVIREWLKTS